MSIPQAMTEAVAMAADTKWDRSIFHNWDNGGVELFALVAELAQISSDLCDALMANHEIPGTWAYEVSGELGDRLHGLVDMHRDDLSVEIVKPVLGEIAWKFFREDGLVPCEVSRIILAFTGFSPAPEIPEKKYLNMELCVAL